MRVNKKGCLEVRDRFDSDVRRFYPWSPKPEMYVAGAVAVFEAKDPAAQALNINRAKMVQYLEANREKLPEQRAAEALVWLIQAAHTHKDYGYSLAETASRSSLFPGNREGASSWHIPSSTQRGQTKMPCSHRFIIR